MDGNTSSLKRPAAIISFQRLNVSRKHEREKAMRKQRRKKTYRSYYRGALPANPSQQRKPWLLAIFFVAIGALSILLLVFTMASHQQTADRPPLTSPANPHLDTQVTSEPIRTGIFSLSTHEPLPIPANVLHPTNMARVVTNNVMTAIYAGFMTREPARGALFVLQENLTTGQETTHIYQMPQPAGALTILAIENQTLRLSLPNGKVTFDLQTTQFHF